MAMPACCEIMLYALHAWHCLQRSLWPGKLTGMQGSTCVQYAMPCTLHVLGVKAALGRLGGPVHLARAPPCSAMIQHVSKVGMQVEIESHHDARGPMSGTTMTQVQCGEEAELSPAPN